MTWYGLTFTVEGFVQLAIVVSVFYWIYTILNPERYDFRIAARIKLFKKLDPLVRFGAYATLTFVFLIMILYGFPSCDDNGECTSKVIRFFKSSPNELGDAIAGVFSALAFLWIIVTVLLQSKELKEQRAELKDQRLATQDMAKAMAAQSQILEDEKKIRYEERAKLVLEQAISNIEATIRYINRFDTKWPYATQANDEQKEKHRAFSSLCELSGDEMMSDLSRQLLILHLLHLRNSKANRPTTKSTMRREYEKILKECMRINSLSERIGEDQRIRISRLDLEDAAEQLTYLLGMDIWEQRI